MAVETQVIRFTKETTGVNGATQDVSLNFTPKAIIVFSTCQTDDDSVADHYQWSQGFSDGTNHTCRVITSDDGDAVSDTAQYLRNDAVYLRLNETSNGSAVEQASVAFATNKVTFTWTVASTAATLIIIWAVGGDDITNAKVATVDVGRSTAGTQDYTGLGFDPVADSSVLFTIGSNYLDTQLNTIFSNANQSFGCAVSSTKRWTISNVMEDAQDPSDTWRYYSDTHCFSSQLSSSGSIIATADFDSWITDGFRLDWDDPSSSSLIQISYLVIKGGTWDCGNLQSPTTATNDVDYAVSVSSNTIRGLLMASTGLGTLDTSSDHAIVSVGATDGTTQGCIANIDEDIGGVTSDSYRVNNITNIIRPLTLNGANMEVATLDSFTTNNFRLDWGTADATQRYYGWVVVADTETEAPAAEEANGIMNFLAVDNIGAGKF